MDIADQLHVALLDTGASINVVPESLAHNVKVTPKFKINGVNELPITKDQNASKTFILGGRSFFVDTFFVPSLSYDFILGITVLRKINTLLDFKRN